MELCANARACGRARGLRGLGDRRIAVGIGFVGGVGWITRTRPDVLGPGAHPNRHVTVRTGFGGLFALAGDLAVLALAGRTRLGFRQRDRRILGVRLAVTQRLALAVVDVIDRACGVLRVGVSKECRRGFVVGFGTALARGAYIERLDLAECLELTLSANVERSGEACLEEVFAQAQRWVREFLRGALPTVAAFDRECGGVLLARGVDRDLFAFAQGSVAGRAVGVSLRESRAGEQLGTVGGDFGQHRSATSQSLAWKASR